MHARQRDELGRLAVAQRDRAGLVQQQRVHVAGRFDGASRHRQHVVLDEAVHAGDADGREQATDRRRDQADEQRNQHEQRLRRARIDRKRLQRHHGDQEHDRQARQQDVQRNLIGRLLPLRALDERNHAVEEGLAGIGGDADADPVRQHPRAAGDRRPVSAGLPDDRRRLAGDRAFVHRRDALDDLAVGRDQLAGLDADEVALAQHRRGHAFERAVCPLALRHGFALRLAKRFSLRLAAPLGHRLGEVREQHRQPQPERDLQLEADVAGSR